MREGGRGMVGEGGWEKEGGREDGRGRVSEERCRLGLAFQL